MNQRLQNRLGTMLSIAILVFATSLARAQQKPEELAQQSAGSWLVLVDVDKYGESWEQAATIFKAAITKADWQGKVGAVRAPLGKEVSRKLKSAQFTKTLPGAPDGQYVVIQYDTSFEHKQSAIETVVPMLDKDGQWRVSGYFIR
jgi:Protein of unknown function (DUF4019)